MTGYGLEGWGSFPSSDKRFLSLYNVQTDSGAHPASYTVVVGSGFLRVKAAWAYADHSPPSSDDVKNGGATPPLPHTSSRIDVQLIKHRENFTCITYLSLTLPNTVLGNRNLLLPLLLTFLDSVTPLVCSKGQVYFDYSNVLILVHLNYCSTSSVVMDYLLENSTCFSVTQIISSIVYVSLLFSLERLLFHQAILKSQFWDYCSLIFLFYFYNTTTHSVVLFSV
jgi:hypothetical protein